MTHPLDTNRTNFAPKDHSLSAVDIFEEQTVLYIPMDSDEDSDAFPAMNSRFLVDMLP